MLAVTGPHQYEQVLDAVHQAVPPSPDPFVDLLPASGVKLTLDITVISRFQRVVTISASSVLSQICADAYKADPPTPSWWRLRSCRKRGERAFGHFARYLGLWCGHQIQRGRGHRAHIVNLARDLGTLGAWVRLHYVYPYPHVRDLIPLMAEGLILPYLDIPFQHAHPDVLRRMARPAAAAKTLDEITAWRGVCPDITLRSTFNGISR